MRGRGQCQPQTGVQGGSVHITPVGGQHWLPAGAPDLPGARPRPGGGESYPHLPIDPVCKHGHVPVHARPVRLGTARSPACVPNQPPDAALQSDQRTATVTLGTQQVTGSRVSNHGPSAPLALPRAWGAGWGRLRGLQVGVRDSCLLPRGNGDVTPTGDYASDWLSSVPAKSH